MEFKERETAVRDMMEVAIRHHRAERLAEARTIYQEVEKASSLNLGRPTGSQTIDYLSIDTEGSELEILSAFDFERFYVRIITVEHNFTDTREPLRQLLESKGFVREFTTFSKEDDWYFHPDRL